MLAQVKQSLKRFAETTLMAQVNAALENERITSVEARFVRQWEWCVTLRGPQSEPTVFVEFGPTAVVENERAPERLGQPDYAKVFVTRQDPGDDGIDYIAQTDVELGDVLRGRSPGDDRLCNAVLKAIGLNDRT